MPALSTDPESMRPHGGIAVAVRGRSTVSAPAALQKRARVNDLGPSMTRAIRDLSVRCDDRDKGRVIRVL